MDGKCVLLQDYIGAYLKPQYDYLQSIEIIDFSENLVIGT